MTANADTQALRNKPVPAQPETPSRYIKENSELRQKLIEAENKVAELQKLQAQKRLSEDQRRFLIEALRPFPGQKIAVASILATRSPRSSRRTWFRRSRRRAGITPARPACSRSSSRAIRSASR